MDRFAFFIKLSFGSIDDGHSSGSENNSFVAE